MITETINFGDEKLYTSKEVYSFLKIHKTTLFYYVEKGFIKSINIGTGKRKNLRFYGKDVKNFISNKK